MAGRPVQRGRGHPVQQQDAAVRPRIHRRSAGRTKIGVMVLDWLLVLVAYCIGAIPFAYVVPRALAGVDVRMAGSRNVGAANVLRTTRAKLAIAVVALDIAKGAFAVWL